MRSYTNTSLLAKRHYFSSTNFLKETANKHIHSSYLFIYESRETRLLQAVSRNYFEVAEFSLRLIIYMCGIEERVNRIRP